MRANEFIKEAKLGNVLPWPEVVNKVNSTMKAMGWKGQRKDDGSFMFSTKGQLDDEFYIVIIDNEGNSMFTYALGTVEEGDPHIGEENTLPTTEASISELMDAIREGFGLSEQMTEGWSSKYKKSINCSNPKGFSQKAHCAGKKKNEDIELEQEFDLIESIIERLARHNGVDAELVWEDLDELTDDELYVFAVTSEPIMEDWQKANKRDKTDGMSQKAVNAYRRENPGSKLKTAVTTKPSKLKKGSKASKRRKSYCSRSRGQMKMHSISCAKTPDKAICKARRRWNC